MDKTEAIAILVKEFPGIEGIQDAEPWGGKQCDTAIHLGNAAEGGEIDKMPAADYYSQDFREHTYLFGVHKKLVNRLHKLGFVSNWYDPGTLLAYPM